MSTTIEMPVRAVTTDSIDYAIEGSSANPNTYTKSFLKKRTKTNDVNEVTHDLVDPMFRSEINPHDFPDGGRDAYRTLAGSCIGLIIDFGIANSLGAIESYVSSHQLQNVKDTSVSWVFTLHLGVMYFGAMIFGELFDKFGTRKLLVSSTIFMSVGLFCTAESTQLSHFILSFGITTAIGASMGMAPLIGVLSHWFLKKRAFAYSIATIGGLIGSSIFAVMLQRLYDQVGFKWAIRVLGFICLTCMTSAIYLIKEREPTGLKPSFSDPETFIEEPEQEQHTSFKEKVSNFFKDAIDLSIVKDIRFVWLVSGVWLAELITVSSLTYLTSYGLDHGVSNSDSYLLITLVNVCGIPSRLLTGILADKYGRFNVMIASTVLTTIVVFGIWLPAKGDIHMLFAFAVLFGIATSSTVSLIPASTSQICSADKFGKVYGTLYFFLAFLTILGMYVASVVLGTRTETDYRNFVLFIGATSVAALISWIGARYCSVGWKMCKF